MGNFEIIFGTEPDLISYKLKEASHKNIFLLGRMVRYWATTDNLLGWEKVFGMKKICLN